MTDLDLRGNLLIEAHSLGPVASYALISQSQNLVLEKCEHYQKRSYRNRYKINTSNGYQVLSIPLAKGKNNHLAITEVKIAYDENWIAKHLQTLMSAYGRSAYYEYYYDEISTIFNCRYEYLWDLNLTFLEYFIKKLHLDIALNFTSDYKKEYQSLTDVRSGYPWDKFHISQYTPVWDHNCLIPSDVSIIDLLFSMGPEAILFLKQSKVIPSLGLDKINNQTQ